MTELTTTFFAVLRPDLTIEDNGRVVGVAVPSFAWPGSLMLCLNPAIVAAARATYKESSDAA